MSDAVEKAFAEESLSYSHDHRVVVLQPRIVDTLPIIAVEQASPDESLNLINFVALARSFCDLESEPIQVRAVAGPHARGKVRLGQQIDQGQPVESLVA